MPWEEKNSNLQPTKIVTDQRGLPARNKMRRFSAAEALPPGAVEIAQASRSRFLAGHARQCGPKLSSSHDDGRVGRPVG
jgi:hypothetical protein